MTIWNAILLGLVQGIAEFLPISSSGHLAIARNLLNMEGAGSIPEFFDVLLHLGTLIAVFAAYWGDIRDMVVEFFRGIGDLAHRSTPTPVPPARRLILLIVVGTLPLFAVLSVLPAADDVVYIAAVCVLLFMVGLGCIAFVYSGTYYGAMEKLLEDGINEIGLGPQGMGGKYSVMGVNIENTARHPSTIGVAVNVGCWSHRRGHIVFDKDLNYKITTHSEVTL